MNHGGDAAEQIVRMSLNGVEVAARITGTAAKEIALLILAAIKEPDKGCKIKLKGKERLSSMLKSGKPLEIFSVKESDLKQFSQAAKDYGIVYCVLRSTKNSPDGLCDVMVKADDAPKISRIVERFNFATVDRAKVESEIVADRAERTADVRTGEAPEAPDINDTDKLLDDLMGTPEGKTIHEAPAPEPKKSEPGKETPENRPLAENGRELPKSLLYDHTSESERKPTRGTSSKPSVEKELREIKAARKAKEADASRRDEPAAEKPKTQQETTHKQPPRGKKTLKKTRGSR